MLKEHPRGLFIAFFANMGERFGFYTMVAIFVLFLQAKYGFSSAKAGDIYSWFLAGVYFLPLLGGFVADKLIGYGKTISLGLIVMFIGYALLAVPTTREGGLGFIYGSLIVISLGTGLFKGNLQALVGNLYDDPKYSSKRDVAFNIFYMGINIGAMFAPTAAEEVVNWVLKGKNFFYDARIPALAHSYLDGNLDDTGKYLDIAQQQDPSVTLGTLSQFSDTYINALGDSYHYGFGVACLSLIVSMIVFWGFRKYYRHADVTETQKARRGDTQEHAVVLTRKQTIDRLVALGLVFFVVIFFWASFHQNAVCLTYFARDYTVGEVGKFTNLWFDLFGLLPIFLALLGLYFMLRKNSAGKIRLLGAIGFVVFAVLAYLRFQGYESDNPFTPQKFQHFNPFFIVALTPLIVALFSWMGKKNIEPSAPKKIGIGMMITSLAFVIMVVGSLGLASPQELEGQVAPQSMLVSPYWLITTYFTLTVAELFLSPMGISFVSKVSPPKLKGLMQGGWLAATAIGNKLLFIPALLWEMVPLWLTWFILVVACLLSAIFIFSILKRLERATQN